jgi:hypothetical protein
MKNNNIILLILGMVTAFVAYDRFFNEAIDKSQVLVSGSSEVIVSDSSDLIAQVSDEFNKIESKDDKILIYKLFSGAANFLEVCEDMDGTYQFDPILSKVQTSYGWDREKYPSFTDAVSNYLISVGYDIPKPLKTKEERMEFSKIFKALSEATKHE